MFTNMLRKRMESPHLHEAQAAFRSKRSCTDNLFVLTRILQEAGNKPTLCVLSGRAKRMMVWRDGLSAKLLRCGWLWRVLRDLAIKSTTSQGERGPVRSFPLSGVGQGTPIYAVVRYLYR
jgi:hypothetical protein